MPLLQEVKAQVPHSVSDIFMDNSSRALVVNSTAPPFDRPEVRRAVALSLDRQAFLDILVEREGAVGGAMLPPPDGVWGMTPDIVRKLPGYGSDVAGNREEARALMQKAGYGPERQLAIKVSTRNIPAYRDAAVIAISQLREIYIDAELDLIDTASYFPRLARKDYQLAVDVATGGLDDPDQKFYENYVCGAERNYTGYCDPEADRPVGAQTIGADPDKRPTLVGQIERRLAEDGSRPVLLYSRFANCKQPRVKDLVIMTNSGFNGWRMEDVWLDR